MCFGAESFYTGPVHPVSAVVTPEISPSYGAQSVTSILLVLISRIFKRGG